jgi:hypothetical protein
VALEEFSPPGFLDELTPLGRRSWSRHVAEQLDGGVIGDASIPNDSPRAQFFNPLGVPLTDDAARKAMAWGAFPRKLAREPAPRRWVLGEDRNRQEEYCEWAAETDGRGRILRATFTTETPEYFHLLGAVDPDRLVAVYREHVSPAVRPADLFSGSVYRPVNRWNLLGAMHMIQGANTLGAAITLVAQSSIVRRGATPGTLLTNANDLIRCGVNADMDRNSDPLIVGDVNALARQGAAVSLDDPAGLYLAGLTTPGWQAPDGSDPMDHWRITRGADGFGLRAVYAVPPERGFTVSDITINGRPIESPSQIAEFIEVRITGVAHGFGAHEQTPSGCSTDAGGDALEGFAPSDDEEVVSVAGLMAASRRVR